MTLNPINIIYGTLLANSQLTSGSASNTPGVFTYTSDAGKILNGGYGQLEAVTFTPTDTADYMSVSLMATVNVYFTFTTSVWAWGDNSIGQLGTGNNNPSNVPVQVCRTSSGVTAIARGVVLKPSLSGRTGRFGTGATTLLASSAMGPITIATFPCRFRASAASSPSPRGKITPWPSRRTGRSGNGAITVMDNSANGTNTSSNVPVQVANLTGVIAIAAGDDETVALTANGTVWDWGSNSGGQLGTGNHIDSNVPVQVLNLTGVTAIAAGHGRTLALKSDGTVWDWGDNFDGELGNGTNTDSSVPVQVSSLSGVTAIAGGDTFSVALKSDGTVWDWGSNSGGELGNGTTLPIATLPRARVSNPAVSPPSPQVALTPLPSSRTGRFGTGAVTLLDNSATESIAVATSP